MVKRTYYALGFLSLFVFGTIFGCTTILGIDTSYEDNPCNGADAGVIPAQECGAGACRKLEDKRSACENGLPISCKPGEPCPNGFPVTCTPADPQDSDTCNDGLDNDCDGNVDEDDCACTDGEEKPCFTGSADTRNVGVCRDGKQICANGVWGQCVGDVVPTSEECDTQDNDCDGEVDESCTCKDGDQQYCYGGPSGTINVGPCTQGTQTCKNGVWDKCIGDITPDLEVCDGKDNDCDGKTDEVCECVPGDTRPCYTGPAGTDTNLPCLPGVQNCINGKFEDKCTGEILPTAELCNAVDDNCNGSTDDGVAKVGEECFPTAVGPCYDGKGKYVCLADGLFCDPNVKPKSETCNDIDDDCDGDIDEGNFCCPNDFKQNGNETDVDCGGACSTKCDNGKKCVKNEDCNSGSCSSGSLCQAPQCNDTVQNGGESDVDCGSVCPTKCQIGKKCNLDVDCQTNVCDPASKLCAQKPIGYACIAASECASGFCIDGYCCNINCTGPCKACSALKKGSGSDGTCGNIAQGTDPDDECGLQTPSTCGTTGYCDGAGSCQLYSSTTECAPPSCSTSTTLIEADLCNGLGSCNDKGTKSCAPYICSNGACLTDCTLDTDCSTTAYCGGTTCLSKRSDGAACSAAKECLSNSCVDGVCCDTACNSTCQACTATKKGSGTDGVCGLIKVDSDPDNECATELDSTCGQTGFCDGAGACKKYPQGTVCQNAVCSSGTTQENADTCDGLGNCVDNGQKNCSPSTCGNGVCLTICTNDSQCDTTAYCNGVNCQQKKVLGSPCGDIKECLSGSCVDGVCCNTTCNGSCQACTAAKKGTGVDGYCDNVLTGADPDNECAAQNSNTCGTTGVCNGSGACEKFSNQTTCATASCLDATTLKPAVLCDGNGTCPTQGTVPCTPFTCANGACLTSCTNDTQCSSNAYCNGAVCLLKEVDGAACSAAKQCLNGNCVDGVCCDLPCGGTCQACTAAKKGSGLNGTCGPIALGSNPDNECMTQNPDTCGTTGVCNGANACQLYSNSTECNPSSCAADGITLNLPDKCSGTGTCSDGGTSSCAPFACQSGACLTMCSSDMQCAPNAFCNGTVCTTKLSVGAACTASNQCALGFCVDGFCCDGACGGPCQACSAAKKGQGADGACGPVKSGLDPDNECTDQGAMSCGTNGSCNGAGVCDTYTNGTVCVAAVCAMDGITLNKADSCSGGMCADGGAQDCSPYLCANGACPTTCANDAACVTGYYCDGTSHCVLKKANGVACGATNECQSGNFCVDSYCCDSACNGTCETCSAALGATQNGTCSAVPAGQNPDNDCTDQGASTCGTNGSCNGFKACATYPNGTVCQAATCVGNILHMTDSCSAGTCTDGGTQDCSPYPCLNGACSTSCANDTECLSTHYCDLTQNPKVCVTKKANGLACGGNNQCISNKCTSGICEPATCGNGSKDGDETDVDCGGSCIAGCAVDEACLTTMDCATSLQCNMTALLCEPATCGDGSKNGDENNTDCGGSCVAGCASGDACNVASDCDTGLKCTSGTCEPTTCGNGSQDGDETGTDCGGSCIAACADGQGCMLAIDCVSQVCTGQICQAPTCFDGVQNGTETLTDCGGSCPCTVLVLGTKNNTTIGGSFQPTGTNQWVVNTSVGSAGASGDNLALTTITNSNGAPEGVGLLRTSPPGDDLQQTKWTSTGWTAFATIGSETTDMKPSITSTIEENSIAHGLFRSKASPNNYYYLAFDVATPTPELVSDGINASTGTTGAGITVLGNNATIAFLNTGVFTRDRDAAATPNWLAEVSLTSAGNLMPEIVTLSTGTQLLAVADSSARTVYFATRPSGGTWSTPISVAFTLTGTESVASRVSLAALPGGNAAIAFRESTGSQKLYVSFYNGTSWSAPANVSSYTTAATPAISRGVGGHAAELAFIDPTDSSRLYHTSCTGLAANACLSWTTKTKVDNTNNLTSIAIASWP